MYLHKDFPFIYRVSFDKNVPALVVYIDPNQIGTLGSLDSNSHLVKWVREKINPNTFETDVLKNFGYEGVCENKGVVNGLLALVFKIPIAVSFSENKCSQCGGTCKQKYGDGTCWYCRCTGKEKLIKNSALYNLSATLMILFKLLNGNFTRPNEVPSQGDFGTQPAILDLYIGKECMNDAAIGGECQMFFLEAIKNKEMLTTRTHVIESLYFIDQYINNASVTPSWDHFHDEYEFRCDIQGSGLFYLEVPGTNGCSLYVERGSGDIRTFSCHNIDSPWQQISLLIGFASLWDVCMPLV